MEMKKIFFITNLFSSHALKYHAFTETIGLKNTSVCVALLRGDTFFSDSPWTNYFLNIKKNIITNGILDKLKKSPTLKLERNYYFHLSSKFTAHEQNILYEKIKLKRITSSTKMKVRCLTSYGCLFLTANLQNSYLHFCGSENKSLM